MKNNHWYLILIVFSLWALDEIFLFRPDFFFVSLCLGSLAIIFYVKALMKERSRKFWPAFALPPIVFFLSFSLYSAIIVSRFWIQAIFLVNVWFVFCYLKNIYYYFSFGAPEREDRLRRLLASGAFLSTFALAANLYGLPIFLSWPFWLLLLSFAVISIGLFGQTLILTKEIDRGQKIWLGINILVLAEFAGALFFLPFNYNILGLLVAIVFYLLFLFDDWRRNNYLTLKNAKWPVIIVSALILLILLTASWL